MLTGPSWVLNEKEHIVAAVMDGQLLVELVYDGNEWQVLYLPGGDVKSDTNLTSWCAGDVAHVAAVSKNRELYEWFHNPSNPDGWRFVNISHITGLSKQLDGALTSWVVEGKEHVACIGSDRTEVLELVWDTQGWKLNELASVGEPLKNYLTSWISGTVAHVAALSTYGIFEWFHNPANVDGWRLVNLSTTTRTGLRLDGSLTAWVFNGVEHLAGISAAGQLNEMLWHPNNDDGWRIFDLTENAMRTSIYAYGSAVSVDAGQNLSLYIRLESNGEKGGPFTLQVRRVGNDKTIVHSGAGVSKPVSIPLECYKNGCGWDPMYDLKIGDTWKSGLYQVVICAADSSACTYVPFIVRRNANTQNKIAIDVPTATYQAYNNWGGKSLYDSISFDERHSPDVSYERPWNGWLYEGNVRNEWVGDEFEFFFEWLDINFPGVDFLCSYDIHSNPSLLHDYKLIISLWHDEYWSKEMRDNIEAFIEEGGNVCFFGANNCWWQIRYSPDGRLQTCYKDKKADPSNLPGSSYDPERTTVNWYDDPVNRPENTLLGVSYRNGASDRPKDLYIGYTISSADHWVFEGTSLRLGDEFGSNEEHDNPILNGEVDAVLFSQNSDGKAVLTPEALKQGTPDNFLILAYALLKRGDRSWGPADGVLPRATMGIFQKGEGTVFNAGTWNWVFGLLHDDANNPVTRITRTLLNRLSL